MTKITKTQFRTESSATDPTVIAAFFNALNCPHIVASVEENHSVIEINDVIVLRDIAVSNGCTIYMNGTQKWAASRGYSNPYVTVLYGDDFVFLYVCTSNGNWYSSSYGIFYKKCGQKELYGVHTGDGLTSDIKNYTLVDNNTNIEYIIDTVFKEYTPEPDNLDYTRAHLFSGNIKTSNEVPDFFDSSNVTRFSVITFGGNNYFCIGSHCLVSLDEE